MIQRIQTIFLILTAASFGALFRWPFVSSAMVSDRFLADSQYNIQDHPLLLALTCFMIGLCVLAIFLFKNRKLQRKVVYLIIFLTVGLVLAAFFLLRSDSPNLLMQDALHLQFGIFLPEMAIIFGLIAAYFIRKDEQLVKSMDRLR